MIETLVRLFKALFTVKTVGNAAKLGILSLIGTFIASTLRDIGREALTGIHANMEASKSPSMAA